MNERRTIITAIFPTGCLPGIGIAHPAAAATITVNSTADSAVPADGDCTLREAIENANDDVDVTGGDCLPGSGDDSIDMTGLSGQITLTSELPYIGSNVVINAPGARALAVDGNDAFPVFRVRDPSTVEINNLTVQHGNAVGSGGDGGGIRNTGTLTLTNVAVLNNESVEGGGIFNAGDGTLHLINSIVSGNFAEFGGGIDNEEGIMAISSIAPYPETAV
ncbi:MAG: CSLREA domain-containing protein [Pseudomonadota bacterium]